MKKAIVLVMALLMVTCVFAGCGEETKTPATEPETVNVPKDAAVITAITSGEVYGKDVSTFMADITIKNNKASGTLPYVAQYSGYTAAQGDLEGKMYFTEYAEGKYGYGHYIAFEIAAPKDATVSAESKIELISGTDKRSFTGADFKDGKLALVCRLTGERDDVIFTTDWDGEGEAFATYTNVLSTKGVECKSRQDFDILHETILALDNRQEWIQYETYSISRDADKRGTGEVRHNAWGTAEMATRENVLYLDCAGFICAATINSIGYDFHNKESIDIVRNTDQRVLYYEPTFKESQAEKDAIYKDFVDILEPGDVIAYAYYNGTSVDTDGHTMIYIGDGIMAHCAGDVFIDGNYHKSSTGKSYDTEDLGGAIDFDSIYDTLLMPAHARDLMTKSRFAIIRPLDGEYEVNEDAKIRAEKLSGVVIEKYSSHPFGKTADKGQEITINIKFTNKSAQDKALEVLSPLPQGVTLVSGENNFNYTLKSGEDKTFTFTVKVNDDTAYDTELEFETTICGMNIPTTIVPVEKTWTDAEQKKFADTFKSSTFTATNDFDLMVEAYAKIGMTLPVGDAKSISDLIEDITIPTYENRFWDLNPDQTTAGYRMLVPGQYGGMRLYLQGLNHERRTTKVTTIPLNIGDIFIFAGDAFTTPAQAMQKTDMYIYLGDNTFATYDNGVKTFQADGVTRTAHAYGGEEKFLDDELTQLYGSSFFAVLRPSMGN
ncbi:MAG: DUF11 domain-containing protein [Clostridia bacterium]|nr:DUF11 domain-containing protein [Clostridia bacterium]